MVVILPPTKGRRENLTRTTPPVVPVAVSILHRSSARLRLAKDDGFNSLPVDFAQHNIQRSDHRDHVGHQRPVDHLAQCLQIHERRRPHTHAVRLG